MDMNQFATVIEKASTKDSVDPPFLEELRLPPYPKILMLCKTLFNTVIDYKQGKETTRRKVRCAVAAQLAPAVEALLESLAQLQSEEGKEMLFPCL